MADDMSIRVDGAESLDALARVMRKVGDGKEIKKRLAAGLRDAARPAADEMGEALRAKLPKRGGAARAIAGKKRAFTVRNRLVSGSTNSAGVRIASVDRDRDYGSLEDKGILRHPKWPGRRPRRTWRWDEQKVPTKGLLEGVFEQHQPEMLENVAEAMAEAARDVEASLNRGV